MSPQIKQTIIIAGVATLTVVGVLLLTGAVFGPHALVARPGVSFVTGPGAHHA